VPPAAAPEEATPQEAPAPETPTRETPAREQAPTAPSAPAAPPAPPAPAAPPAPPAPAAPPAPPAPAAPPAPPAPAATATPALASAERGVTAVAPAPGAIEPFGPGSAAPRPDGSSPGPEYTIKGNAQSKMFHPPTSPYYGRTRAEVWFRTAADAEAAGFRPYRPRTRG
jgi:hypothetical protein